MIKVPGTEAGLPAIEQLTRQGLNINITLLFSIQRYEQVIDAYLRGLTARAQDGQPIDHITSVASFFLSRIDTKVDPQLPEDSPLRGRVVAGMNVNVWDVNEHVQDLIRSRAQVSTAELADPDTSLESMSGAPSTDN